MKNLKVRVWSKEDKRMYQPRSLEFLPNGFWVVGENVYQEGKFDRANHNDPQYNDPEKFELMLWTSLLDKQGKEIYEGDILIDDEYPEEGISYAVVKWERAGWVADPWFDNKEFFSDIEGYEIVGNIYENPELLKGVINNDTSTKSK